MTTISLLSESRTTPCAQRYGSVSNVLPEASLVVYFEQNEVNANLDMNNVDVVRLRSCG
jgi:hypothetical protein